MLQEGSLECNPCEERSPFESPPSARELSERETEKRLDTDVRKCHNAFSLIKLNKKGLLGVEKGIPP